MLLLDQPSPDLIERFHGGRLASASPKERAVLTRWARVARLGLAPDSAAFPEGASDADLLLRKDRLEEVFREEAALLDEVAGELAARDVVALLADTDGVVLASRGGGAFHDGALRARLVEGAAWSEGARGTNAIGTALAEGRAIAVVGRAHYELRITDLFCYATPVRDPYGEVVTILDVTGAMARHDSAIAVAVQAAGSALERTLRARAFARAVPGGLSVLERLVGRSHAPAFLVEASGLVRVASPAARELLRSRVVVDPSAPTREGRTCERIFGMSFTQLVGHAGRTAQFEARGASFSVELDPLLAPDGRPLAVIVYLETVRGKPSRTTSRTLAAPGPRHAAFAPLHGNDPRFVGAIALAQRFAATPLPVLLLAETGTGKELFARAIHGASPRATRPFVALNCAAISESLVESELFGHAPGAFTGASRTGSEGMIGAASGGTLFLDEIAELPAAPQAALLRVLDDGAYYRVGEARARRSDFRLVCATSRDLPALVEQGAFRRDLFYRICGACVTIPPLRERTDRLEMAVKMLQDMTLADGGAPVSLAEDATAWLEQHTWPGNVRELKTALLHARALAGDGPIAREHFPDPLVTDGDAGHAHAPGDRTREELLRDEYEATLRACSGNVSDAARRLGVARSTIYRTLKK